VSTETGPESMEPVYRVMPRMGGRSVPRVRGRTVAVFSVVVLGLLTLGAAVFSIVTAPRLSTVPTVESHKPTSLKPGQYYYTEVFYSYIPATVQTWVAPNGSGRQVMTTKPSTKWSTTAERAASVREGTPTLQTPSDERTAQGFGATYAFTSNPMIQLFNLSQLSPKEPTTVARLIANARTGYAGTDQTPLRGLIQVGYDCGTGGNSCVELARTALLLQGPAVATTAARRAALVKAMAHIPGVTVLRHVADPVGQRGTELQLVKHYRAYTERYDCDSQPGQVTRGSLRIPITTYTFDVIVNPKTWTLLSTESTSPSDTLGANACTFESGSVDVPPMIETGRLPTGAKQAPVTSDWTLPLQSGVVDSNSATP
jgi:hypothetical protein